MRGLCGLINFSGTPIATEELATLVRALVLEPGDRPRLWSQADAGLAHFARPVLVEDEWDRQPRHHVAADVALVTDAQLDNRAELAAVFRWDAATARGRADSEFVLEAYLRWGADAPARLAGTFALAAWHPRDKRLVLALDPLGARPLYLQRQAQRLMFATTLRALLLQPGVPREIDEEVLAFHVARAPTPTSRTLYRGIERVLPGHVFVATPAGSWHERYWNPSCHRVLQLAGDADYEAAFRTELERSVATALARRRGPVAIWVSGGLDSSAVAAVAGQLLAATGEKLHAIHIRRARPNRYATTGRELDESDYVRALQRHAPHIEFHFLDAPESAPADPDSWDDLFDDHRVPLRGLVGAADPRQAELLDSLGITTLLDGLGGNYLASLECQPEGHLASLAAAGRWATWARELAGYRRRQGGSWVQLIRRSVIGPLRRHHFPRWRVEQSFPRARLLHPSLRARVNLDEHLRTVAATWSSWEPDFRARLHRVLTQSALQQGSVSPAALWRGGGTRRALSPLLDVRLNEFCLSLPVDQQIRPDRDRRLMRDSLRDLLPEVIRERFTRGLPQPDFQRDFRASRDRLRAAFASAMKNPAVQERLDTSWIDRQWTSARSFGAESALAEAVMLARFLAWHSEKKNGSLREPSNTGG
jgi:asparagine synthase (glutamine-hydrolysing)